MITQLYKDYFQKSQTLLYPLLDLKKDPLNKPVSTFIEWKGAFTAKDRKLICVFRKQDTETWRNFEKTKLLNHKMLDFCQEVGDNKIAYVFDMNCMARDYDAFLAAKYSKFSDEAKRKIAAYYGIHTPEWVHVESFIFPEKYHEIYASLLGEDIRVIREVHELCSPYDRDRETLVVVYSDQPNA
jgi:hypothetical protein